MSNYYNEPQYDDDHEHIYYNIKIDNPQDNITNSATQNCVYNKQTQNILPKQSDYEMAVDSFSVRARLPVFVCPIQTGAAATNRDLTPFIVNYRYTTVPGGVITNFPTTILYLPDVYATSSNRPPPLSPNNNNGLQDFSTNPDYYNINSIERFVEMVNSAFQSSYNAFNAAHPGVNAERVFIQFDDRTKLFSLVYPFSMIGAASGGVTTIGMDAMLYKYFDSLPAAFNAYDSNGMDYELTLVQKPGQQNNYSYGNHYAGVVPVPTISPPAYLISNQESDSRHLWNNIKHVLVTSSSISVRSEYMPFSNFPTEIIKRDVNTFNQNKKSVIAYIDYSILSPKTSTTLHRDLLYHPKINKWIDLISDDQLNNINCEFSLVFEDGRVTPLNLPKTATATLDLLFRKKSL